MTLVNSSHLQNGNVNSSGCSPEGINSMHGARKDKKSSPTYSYYRSNMKEFPEQRSKFQIFDKDLGENSSDSHRQAKFDW